MRPYKVLLFIFACLAVLAALCFVLPHEIMVGERTLRWPTLAEVLGSEEPFVLSDTIDGLTEFSVAPDSLYLAEAEEALEETDSLQQAEKPKKLAFRQPDSTATREVEQASKGIDTVNDTRVFLRAFYASLAETSERVVRVMHYGDSQIEEDRMTQQIREVLQDKYGGRGAGLLPLAQTIPSRTVRQEIFRDGKRVSAQNAARRYMVYGLKRDQRSDGLYGPMGQVTWMADSLVKGSENLTAVVTPLDGRPRYTRWKVFADDSIQYTFSGDSVLLSGKGAVYGLSQQSSTGIIVDNVPMRGCLGLVFTKMSSAQLRRFYREENVKLIIMQYGGNAIPFNEKPGTVAAIVSGLRDQVRYVKNCAPGASILFIGPSDMMRQTDGVWESYPLVPYMDRLLNKMAKEEGIAYFSLFRWMGGSGSMYHWQDIGLASSDGVHFHRSGARKAGNAVVNWILEGNTN